MIRTVCPKCDTPLMAPDEYAGKTPRCPMCRTKVPAEKKLERPALIEEILAAAPPSQPSPQLKVPAGGGVLERKTSAVLEKAVRAVEPAQPHGVSKQWWVTVASIAAVVLIGFVLIVYARRQAETTRIRSVLDRVKMLQGNIAGHEKDGRAALDKKAYSQAKDFYRRALDTAREAQSLLASLPQRADGPQAGEMETAREVIERKVKELTAILNSDPIQKGSQGYLEFEGRWVPKEEYERLFAERMKAQGRELYEGEWLPFEEVQKRRGLVKYGEQWIPQEQYAAIMAQEAERKRQEAERERQRQEAAARRRREMEEARRLAEEKRKAEEEEKARRFPPDKALWILEDFEAGNSFRAENWPNANPVTLEVVQREGSRMLHVATPGGGQEKIAFSRPVAMDWSSRTQLTLDIESTATEAVRLAIAVETDTFYESRPRIIRPGVNKAVSFNLDAGDFKSVKTGWTHATAVNQRNYVVRLYFLVYYARKADFYVDNIYLKK